MKRRACKCLKNMSGQMLIICIVKVIARYSRNCTKFCLTLSTQYVMYLKQMLFMPEWMRYSISVSRDVLVAGGKIKPNYLPERYGYCGTILPKGTANSGY